MIAMLKGRIAEKSAAGIILDVNGVGYELSVPMSTFCSLPDVGHEAKLFVQMTVREDAILEVTTKSGDTIKVQLKKKKRRKHDGE